MYLDIHRNTFQATVCQGLPQKVERLVFSKKEFSNIIWEEQFKEFEWKGSLYDVSKMEKTKDDIVIYCVNDSEEESIIAFFKEWKKSNLPVSKTKLQLQPLFCSNLFVEIERLDRVERQAFSGQTSNYHLEKMQIPSPPPW